MNTQGMQLGIFIGALTIFFFLVKNQVGTLAITATFNLKCL